MAKQAESTSREEVVAETDNNPVYRTVLRELRTLKDAAENVTNGRWSAIKDKAAGTTMFVTRSYK